MPLYLLVTRADALHGLRDVMKSLSELHGLFFGIELAFRAEARIDVRVFVGWSDGVVVLTLDPDPNPV